MNKNRLGFIEALAFPETHRDLQRIAEYHRESQIFVETRRKSQRLAHITIVHF